MATHSSLLACGTAWTEEPGGLQSIGLHSAGHDLSDLARSYRGLGRHHCLALIAIVQCKDGMSSVPFLLIQMLFLRQ